MLALGFSSISSTVELAMQSNAMMYRFIYYTFIQHHFYWCENSIKCIIFTNWLLVTCFFLPILHAVFSHPCDKAWQARIYLSGLYTLPLLKILYTLFIPYSILIPIFKEWPIILQISFWKSPRYGAGINWNNPVSYTHLTLPTKA